MVRVAMFFRSLGERLNGGAARRAAEMEAFVADEVRRLNSERARKGWATRRAKAADGAAVPIAAPVQFPVLNEEEQLATMRRLDGDWLFDYEDDAMPPRTM